jgi:hypothetical protein
VGHDGGGSEGSPRRRATGERLEEDLFLPLELAIEVDDEPLDERARTEERRAPQRARSHGQRLGLIQA